MVCVWPLTKIQSTPLKRLSGEVSVEGVHAANDNPNRQTETRALLKCTMITLRTVSVSFSRPRQLILNECSRQASGLETLSWDVPVVRLRYSQDFFNIAKTTGLSTFLNQRVSAVRLGRMSLLGRVQLQRDKCNSAVAVSAVERCTLWGVSASRELTFKTHCGALLSS